VKQIFEKAYKVEVRDKNSFNTLQKLWIRVKIKPDPVFYDNLNGTNIGTTSLVWIISSFDFNKENLKNLKLNLKWKTVWLALRGGYFVKKSKLSIRLEEWIMI
jgi:hypothetical protein